MQSVNDGMELTNFISQLTNLVLGLTDSVTESVKDGTVLTNFISQLTNLVLGLTDSVTESVKDGTELTNLMIESVNSVRKLLCSLNRFAELGCVDRDVRLHVGKYVVLAAANPAVCKFERNHHAGNRTIVRIIPLCWDSAHRRCCV